MPIVTKGGPSAVPEADYYEVPEETNTYSWSPDPVPGRSPSTQVHLHFGKPPGTVFMVRFKSPRSITALIEALTAHRNDVWPNLCPACRGIGYLGVMKCGECAGKGERKP